MVKQTGIHAQGVNQLMRTMSKMGKEISDHARDGSMEIAEKFLSLVRANASTVPETKAAAVLKVYRDRVPKVGFPAGTRVAVSGKPKIGEFFYGTEFGGGEKPTTRQFRNHQNTHFGGIGFFFYPVMASHGEGLALEWFDVVMGELTEDWNRGAAKAAMGGAP